MSSERDGKARAATSEGDAAGKDRDGRARCIAVAVAGTIYGLRVEEVQEVLGLRPLTRVFHAPPALAGVTSLRGEVLPVLDLGALVGAPVAAPAAAVAPSIEVPGATRAEARIVVVREAAGERRRAGLLVDALRGLRVLPPELAPVPATASEPVQRLVVGVIPDAPPCSVVSVPSVLGAPELAELAGRATASA
ncbi:MAG: chemotaxis protein CheW [Polyangiaceae bacterium]|nr:chemotaxis protein CheW [Polyangiaceae bacterium]